MSRTTTLKNLVKLTIEKTETLKEKELNSMNGPSAMVISNILNYSKALSIRTSGLLGITEMVLN